MFFKEKWNNSIFIIFLLLFLVAGFAGGIYFSGSDDESVEEVGSAGEEEEKIPVFTDWAKMRSLTEYSRFNAVVTPESTYFVFPQLAEEVDEIYIEKGDKVKEDELLFTLDQKTVEIEQREVEAGVKSAKNQLKDIKSGPRDQEIQEAESNVIRAESALESAKKTYKLLKDEREDLISERQQVIEAENQVYNAKAQRDIAAKQIEEAEIGLEEIESNYKRMESLYEKGALPERDFEEIEYQKQRTEKQLEIAKAQYEQAENNLTTVREGLELAEEVYEKPRSLEMQLVEARNQIEVSKANLKAAKAMLDLLKEGPTEEELAMAEAQVEQAKAARDIVNERRERLKVNSPADGIVSQLEIEEGSLVSPEAQTPPVVLISSVLQIELTVNEDVIVNLEEGQIVDIQVPAVDQLVEGEITYVGVAFDQERGGFPLEIKLDLPGERFKSGMYAAVELPEMQVDDAITVPRSSVFQDGINYYVYIVDETNRVVEKRVEPGASSEYYYEITAGLNKDEEVVIRGQDQIEEGDLVEVRNNEIN